MLRIPLVTLIWIVVASSLHAQSSASPTNASPTNKKFVGSAACKQCHLAAYNGWRQTRMANIVRDPKVHPDAVLGDFTHPDPTRTFSLDQVAFVYGSRWKQRYFEKRGRDYFPLPAQWDIQHRKWLPYLRWLPLRELQPGHARGHRMERRMRKVPWTGQRTCRSPHGKEHRQPGPA